MFIKLALASLWPKKAKQPLAFFEWESLNLETAGGSQKSPQALGAPRIINGWFGMRNFNTRFRLRDTDRHIRLVYTWFLLLMFVGFAFTLVWAHSMTDLTPKGLVEHYRGSDANFGEPMSFGQLAETTHFHIFTMPVVKI